MNHDIRVGINDLKVLIVVAHEISCVKNEDRPPREIKVCFLHFKIHAIDVERSHPLDIRRALGKHNFDCGLFRHNLVKRRGERRIEHIRGCTRDRRYELRNRNGVVQIEDGLPASKQGKPWSHLKHNVLARLSHVAGGDIADIVPVINAVTVLWKLGGEMIEARSPLAFLVVDTRENILELCSGMPQIVRFGENDAAPMTHLNFALQLRER
mmetsp:Transcript_18277/g.29143  ORF Transcript_18277/g.29143 Transcript_18277/m.29143 type:complete len:211 (-) Transcript_18277:538-1170(-)